MAGIAGVLNPLHLTEAMLWQLPGFVTWKDMRSRHIAGSSTVVRLCGFQRLEEFIGTIDYDIRCDAAESAASFIQQDQWALATGSHTSIDINRYADDKVHAHFTQKKAFTDAKGKIIGVACSSIELNDIKLIDLGMSLLHHDIGGCIIGNSLRNTCYSLDHLYRSYKLSRQESECLFYLIRGHRTKTIAQILKLSPRTIESYLNQVKNKLHCYTLPQVIENAKANGFMLAIPSHMLQLYLP
ncbi:MAG: hypothetical protein A2X77_05580 [Gammaproteobacteria bacterium GWE2_42_36]|nr:MAG: hypothetical protein A2X77_05580 [Gammaproteobacteria bacterium GWE2_42_36]